MPLRKKRTAPWTPNGAGRRFHSASGTEKYNPSARFAGTSFYTREVLAGRFTEPCCCLRSKRGSRGRAMRAPTGTAHHPAMWGPGAPPRMVNHPALTPVQEEGVYGGTWFHSPPRCARRGPQWDGLWSLHSWSSRRLARHWPRWQIARGPRCGAELRFRRSAAIVGGCEAPLLEGVTFAPSGRTEKFGPLCGKTGCGFAATHVPRRGTLVPARRGVLRPALCAAGTPMGWTLVAPFLELPPSCAALAALANRARPAVRCRTAFPQKCRDLGGKAMGLYKNGDTAVFCFT